MDREGFAEAMIWAAENGREDVVSAGLERVRRSAETATTEPGVSQDNPNYESIKEDLAAKKQEAIDFADRMERLVELRRPETAAVDEAVNAATSLVGQELTPEVEDEAIFGQEQVDFNERQTGAGEVIDQVTGEKEDEPSMEAKRAEVLDLEVQNSGPRPEGRVTKEGSPFYDEAKAGERGRNPAPGALVQGVRKKGQRITDPELTFEFRNGWEVTVDNSARDEAKAHRDASRIMYDYVVLQEPYAIQSAWRMRNMMRTQVRNQRGGEGLEAIRINEDFETEDGETVQVSRTADVVFQEVDQRIDSVKALIGCMNR
jgi:hypothetical protein